MWPPPVSGGRALSGDPPSCSVLREHMDRSAAAATATEKCGFRPKSIAALQRATRRAHSLS